MASTLPINIPIPTETALANYDWLDFVSKTGYKQFIVSAMADDTSTNYFLKTEVLQPVRTTSATSLVGQVNFSTSSAAFVEAYDITTETNYFSNPATLQGDLICQIPMGASGEFSDIGWNAYVVVTITKYDGSSSTAITSGTSNTMSGGSQATTVANKSYFSFNITIPKTSIKIGEKIKIQVELYVKKTGGTGTAYFILGHDPLNRAISATYSGITESYSQMSFYLPFKIDL
jgi:hypothetical protein